jgi:hypothetical protein
LQVFKFKPVDGGPVTLEQGEIVNYIEDLMWVERYRDAGEFKISSLLSSGLREQLPLGTLISHIDTSEVMMVENHIITDEVGSDTKIEITGRSFDVYLEQRIIGWSLYWAYKDSILSQPVPYTLASGTSYAQALALIKDGINTVRTPSGADDSLINVHEASRITLPAANYPTYGARNMKRIDMYKGLKSILEVDDLGIRVIRPGIGIEGVTPISDVTRFMVHDGTDKTHTTVFSWDLGDLEGADYLFSLKKKKTDAIVVGKYLDQGVISSNTGLLRRELGVDGTDIDDVYNSYPVGTDRTNVLNAMTIRGNEELAAYPDIEITSVNVSKITKHIYRQDYDIGDLVRLDANYGAERIVRVVEYVEIEDKDGTSGYPTLAIPNG